MADPRTRTRQLARESLERGDATGWFEPLYRESQNEGVPISWLDLAPNPYLVEWLAAGREKPRGQALVVGCGYGDDAEVLAAAGFEVTAFDIAPSAIERCRTRFPDSKVRYRVADVLEPPADWSGGFDFVFEAYTVQVLFGPARADAARSIGSLVAPGGTLLVVARSRRQRDPVGEMPWPLTRQELGWFAAGRLVESSLREVLEPGDPPVPRFVAEFRALPAG